MDSLFSSRIMGGNMDVNVGGDAGVGGNVPHMGGVSQFEQDINLAMQMS